MGQVRGGELSSDTVKYWRTNWHSDEWDSRSFRIDIAHEDGEYSSLEDFPLTSSAHDLALELVYSFECNRGSEELRRVLLELTDPRDPECGEHSHDCDAGEDQEILRIEQVSGGGIVVIPRPVGDCEKPERVSEDALYGRVKLRLKPWLNAIRETCKYHSALAERLRG